MMTNDDFALTPEQWKRYDAWATEVARPHWEADAAASIEMAITFRFSVFGRRVEATMGPSRLVIEDPYDLG